MNIKEEIKVLLVRKNLSMSKLVDIMNGKYNRNDSVQNLSNKLNRETIRFNEVDEIIQTLGYKFEIVRDKNI